MNKPSEKAMVVGRIEHLSGPDQRIIPTSVVPAEQTNASLRNQLRLSNIALAEHQRVLEMSKYALESANRLFKGKQYRDAGFNPDGETPIFVRTALTEIEKLRKE